MAQGEPPEDEAEQVQGPHGQPEVRERPDEDEDRRYDGVEQAAAAPRGEDPQEVADEDSDQQRRGAEQDGPTDLACDDF
jgi:hypothetical protein